MPRRLGSVVAVGACGAAVCLSLLAGSSGAAPPGARIKSIRGPVDAVAMDGPLVAYDVAPETGCNRVYVWNVETGAGAVVSGDQTCELADTSTGRGVVQLAVAGQRVAWLVNAGGNTESTDLLFSASLPKPKEARIAEATRTGDEAPSSCRGNWIGGLVGDGSLLAFNRWSSPPGAVRSATSCAASAVSGLLARVNGRRATTIARGTGTLLALSADLGRIAVLRSDGTAGLYGATGPLLRTFTLTSAREIALRKGYLVALTNESTLEVFGARSGRLLFTRPVEPGAAHLDVHLGIAAYAAGKHVYALRLTTGKRALVATGTSAVTDLQIEEPGLVYAFDVGRTKKWGCIGFVPLTRIHAVVG